MANRLKESFLSQEIYSLATRKIMSFVLLGEKTKVLEDKYNKDLCLFNLYELKELLSSFESRSKDSLRSKRTIVGKYINYAIDKGHIKTNKNFIDDITEEDLDNLIYKIAAKDKFISKEELEDICNVCVNWQDEVIFRLLFEGIKGEKLSELINLKVSDVDMNNNIIRISEGNKREIKVLPSTIDSVNFAIKQNEYENYITSTGSRVKVRRLHDTGYVMKKSSRVGEAKIGYQTILGRFKKVRAEAGYPYMTIETVWWSGIFHYARKIIDDNGKLTDNNYDEIIKRFGCSTQRTYKFRVINAIKDNV
ncbi:hypothetical protein [Wukongibacter sp. M2B1]|uniref:phage lytic cycle repressor MrpR family protein n=1 Tax=Wukongibacter sp. M2B1 TaxID=3088895 RepID=UPI003D7ABC92